MGKLLYPSSPSNRRRTASGHDLVTYEASRTVLDALFDPRLHKSIKPLHTPCTNAARLRKIVVTRPRQVPLHFVHCSQRNRLDLSLSLKRGPYPKGSPP